MLDHVKAYSGRREDEPLRSLQQLFQSESSKKVLTLLKMLKQLRSLRSLVAFYKVMGSLANARVMKDVQSCFVCDADAVYNEICRCVKACCAAACVAQACSWA